MTMRPDIKAAWLKDLRDPTNKQTKGTLKDLDGECCMGVLARRLSESFPEVAADVHCTINVNPTECLIDYYVSGNADNQTFSVLPGVLVRAVGLTPALQDTLTSMNDAYSNQTHQYPFPQIADWIERHPAI